jgi:hypothetical protein
MNKIILPNRCWRRANGTDRKFVAIGTHRAAARLTLDACQHITRARITFRNKNTGTCSYVDLHDIPWLRHNASVVRATTGAIPNASGPRNITGTRKAAVYRNGLPTRGLLAVVKHANIPGGLVKRNLKKLSS